jgi:hypothetical protein
MTPSIFFVHGGQPPFLFNGRQPPLFCEWNTTSILSLKHNLIIDGRQTQMYNTRKMTQFVIK